jgi:hypothetical protein
VPSERPLTFQYTDADGWEYNGTFSLPDMNLDIRKDISSSPPGKAQIAWQITLNSPLDEPRFSTTNPGRPDGPTIKPYLEFMIAIPPRTIDSDVEMPPGYTGECDFILRNEGDGIDSFPADSGFRCDLNPAFDPVDGDFYSHQTRDLPEAAADELVRAVRGKDPIWTVQLGECAVFVFPDGKVANRPCEGTGKLQVQVEQ